MVASFFRRLWRLLWSNKRFVLAAIALVAFVAILQEVLEGDVNRLDSMAYSIFVVRLRRPWLTDVMEGISSLASPIVLLMMLLLVAAFAPGRRPGLCATINLASALAINQILKYVVQRPRPDGFQLVSEIGYSFPSGHSMVSMAFYGLCAWMVWHYERDRVMKWVWCSCFALAICLVGVSRIYLGVHYASDVLAGFCVSLAWISVYTKVFCPFFMPEVHEMHLETERDPYYVTPQHLYVPQPTSEFKRPTWDLPEDKEPSRSAEDAGQSHTGSKPVGHASHQKRR